MTTDLHKRLDEAASESFISCLDWIECGNRHDWGLAFEEGIEFGYKEAIAQAKEWLSNNIHSDMTIGSVFDNRESTIADFESDMNKLWEE